MTLPTTSGKNFVHVDSPDVHGRTNACNRGPRNAELVKIACQWDNHDGHHRTERSKALTICNRMIGETLSDGTVFKLDLFL